MEEKIISIEKTLAKDEARAKMGAVISATSAVNEAFLTGTDLGEKNAAIEICKIIDREAFKIKAEDQLSGEAVIAKIDEIVLTIMDKYLGEYLL